MSALLECVFCMQVNKRLLPISNFYVFSNRAHLQVKKLIKTLKQKQSHRKEKKTVKQQFSS